MFWLIDAYIKDPWEKDRLFHAIDTIPAKEKAEWALLMDTIKGNICRKACSLAGG